MEWDLMLEKLRRECFRPTIPPPVRLPRWAVATLVGAGLTLAGAACDRGGSSGPPPVPAYAVAMQADGGASNPPPMPVEPMPPEPPPVPAYAVAMPPDPLPPQVPDAVQEYRAPPMQPSEEKPQAMEVQMRTVSVDPAGAPMYGIPPHLRSMDVVSPKPAYASPRVPPPGPKMYGAPPMSDDE